LTPKTAPGFAQLGGKSKGVFRHAAQGFGQNFYVGSQPKAPKDLVERRSPWHRLCAFFVLSMDREEPAASFWGTAMSRTPGSTPARLPQGRSHNVAQARCWGSRGWVACSRWGPEKRSGGKAKPLR